MSGLGRRALRPSPRGTGPGSGPDFDPIAGRASPPTAASTEPGPDLERVL